MDFTLKIYKDLLSSLKAECYEFQSFNDFVKSIEIKTIVLRHDVDLLPQNSLRFAKIQNKLGISASYYFRAVPESWDEKIIKNISNLGHEVGYHYENMDTCSGDVDKAWDDFRYNLDKLRKMVEVNTICMHGSPRSKFDNKELWNKYDYRSLDIIGEPYYDVDFDNVFYLTDTGRRWDGWKTSVRDKVPQQEEWIKQGLVFHSTQDIIRAVEQRTMNPEPQTLNPEHRTPNFPNQIMFTMHPQRWHNNMLLWTKELLMQNIKNQVKRYFIIK